MILLQCDKHENGLVITVKLGSNNPIIYIYIYSSLINVVNLRNCVSCNLIFVFVLNIVFITKLTT